MWSSSAGLKGFRGRGPVLLCGLQRPRRLTGCPHPWSDRCAITSREPCNPLRAVPRSLISASLDSRGAERVHQVALAPDHDGPDRPRDAVDPHDRRRTKKRPERATSSFRLNVAPGLILLRQGSLELVCGLHEQLADAEVKQLAVHHAKITLTIVSLYGRWDCLLATRKSESAQASDKLCSRTR